MCKLKRAEFAKVHLHRHFQRHLVEKRGLRRQGSPTTNELASALRAAFHSVDAELLQTTQSSSGSTAVCALITPSHMLVANAGDSRAYIWRERRALRMTVKPATTSTHMQPWPYSLSLPPSYA